MPPAVTRRPITPADLPFLARLYASTREEELAVVPWSEAQKAAFLQSQFEAQHQHYATHYTDAVFEIIERAGEAVGRLYVARWPREIRIVDIALLPAHRGQGIGSALLRTLLTEGSERGLPVSIHVERFNPALRLYERLGFRLREDKGVYLLLAWEPSPAPLT